MTSYQPPDGVGVLERDGTIYAAVLPDGPIVVLDGVASLIWRAACVSERGSITARVAAATNVPVKSIQGDVNAFVADLVARGLLEPLRDEAR